MLYACNPCNMHCIECMWVRDFFRFVACKPPTSCRDICLDMIREFSPRGRPLREGGFAELHFTVSNAGHRESVVDLVYMNAAKSHSLHQEQIRFAGLADEMVVEAAAADCKTAGYPCQIEGNPR